MIIESQHYGLHPDDTSFIMDVFQKGKIGIVPTDSVYAFCCGIDHKSGFEAICRLKHLDPKEARMSMICRDLAQASAYFSQWDTPTYRILHRNLPGPFTFILQSGGTTPSFLKNKRKTLGLRIPDHPVIHSVMERMDTPLLVSSVVQDDDIMEFYTDTDQLIAAFEKQVGFIIIEDGYIQEESTVVDLTGDQPEILRQGRFTLKG